MQLTEAATLDRKSGDAEGSAVPGARSFMVSWTDGSGTLQVTFELPFLFVTVWS